MLELKFLGGTIVNCRYTVPVSLAAPGLHDRVVARVEDALARAVLEHPALRHEVIDADARRPAWVAVNEVDFAHHVQWEDVNEEDTSSAVSYGEMLRERIEKLLNQPPARIPGQPQWRVIVLFKKGEKPFLDIVFVYSHALGDGTSGKIFHQTLLRLLNASAATPEKEAETETPVSTLANRVLRIPSAARPLAPPIEKVSKFPLSAKFAITTAWRELLPPGLASLRPSHAHWAPIRPTPFRTRLRVFDIERGVLRGILAASRSHKTTVTGLLHALLLASMASHIPPSDATAFVGSTALDLRRHVSELGPGLDPKRTMADYVSQMTHEFDVDLVRDVREDVDGGDGGDGALSPALVSLIWQCATRVRSEIQKRLDQGLKNDLVGLMKLVPDWRAQFRTEASKARPYSFVVTNLGVLDGAETKTGKEAERKNGDSPVTENWTAEHSVFAISTEVCGAAFQVSPISVRDGALCVSCSWQDCVVDVKLGEAIVADLERWLRFLGRS